MCKHTRTQLSPADKCACSVPDCPALASLSPLYTRSAPSIKTDPPWRYTTCSAAFHLSSFPLVDQPDWPDSQPGRKTGGRRER